MDRFIPHIKGKGLDRVVESAIERLYTKVNALESQVSQLAITPRAAPGGGGGGGTPGEKLSTSIVSDPLMSGNTFANPTPDVVFTPPSFGATVSSVNVSGGSTGLVFTGGPITTAGTITAGGVLVRASGGTGISAVTLDGELIIGSTATGNWVKNTLTAGANISIVNGAGTITISATGVVVGSAYQTIQEEGTPLTQRPTLNFIGAAITAADDGPGTRTNVTLSQSPAGSTSVVGTGRTITTSTGLAGGGDLSADRTLSVVTDSTVQRVEVTLNSGAVVSTRKQLNFIEGANIDLTIADDAGNNQADITVATSASVVTGPAGSNKQVQFNNSSVFGGATGFEYQSGTSPNVLITAQAATHIPLRIVLASLQSADGFEIRDSAAALKAAITISGFYKIGSSIFLHNTGLFNTFVGVSSGNLTLTGDSNTCVGQASGTSITSGALNTIIGRNAGNALTIGTSNTIVGNNAGSVLTTGDNNVLIGRGTGSGLTSGANNVLIGLLAGAALTTAANNTFIGTGAGQNATGISNIFIGANVGGSTTTGSSNSFIGAGAGTANTTGGQSTFIGAGAGALSTGSNNTLIGALAGDTISTGNNNTVIGAAAGRGFTTATFNTIVGADAGNVGTTGSFNVFIGSRAGQVVTSGTKNIYIGDAAQFSGSGVLTGSIAIGWNSEVTASNQLVIGGAGTSAGITDAYIGSGVTNASPAATTFNATGGSGTNIAGAALNLAAGKGTGNALPGVINFKFSSVGASGTALNALEHSLQLSKATADRLSVIYKLKSSTTADRDAASVDAIWTTATDASRTGALVFSTVNNAGSLTERARIAGDGTFTTTSARVKGLVVVTAAGAYTVLATDEVVIINKTSGAATTVNLPASPATGRKLMIKDGKGDAATNNITITPAAGNIDGSSTFIININYNSATIVYNGTEWSIV